MLRLEQEVEDQQAQLETKGLNHLGLGVGFDRDIANRKESLEEAQSRKRREEARKQLYHGFDILEESSFVGDEVGVSPLRQWLRRFRALIVRHLPLQGDLFDIEVSV